MGRFTLSIHVPLLVFVVLSLSLLVSVAYAADDSWVTLEPMPTARSGLGVAVVDGKIYAIGGGTWGNYFGTNEMCDPDTNGWITKTSMPTPRSSFGIAVIENKIYCIGGYTDDEETKINEVYDPATDTWETLTPMPTARYALKANVVNGKIYMIGGHTGDPSPYLDVNEVYDPATDSWTTKTPLTTEVGYYASVVVDNKIYIIGGYGSNLTQIYDPETDTWNNGASIPTVVDSASAGVTTGTMATQRIYVIGGKQDLDAVNLNQIYDPETDTWSTGTPMPTARYGLGVAIVNDVLYALGGKEGWIGSPISVANEQYIPSGYIPEFPSWAILPLVILVMLGAIIYKHKLKRLTFKGHV